MGEWVGGGEVVGVGVREGVGEGEGGVVVREREGGLPPCVTHSLLILFHSSVPPSIPCLSCAALCTAKSPLPPLLSPRAGTKKYFKT